MTYTAKFDTSKEKELKQKLESDGFVVKSAEYAFWRAQKAGLTVTFYTSGKLVAQGKDVEGFTSKFLGVVIEPSPVVNTVKHSSWIGTDESGKGDYFGPLVVAAVHIDENNLKIFQELNVRDSKTIKDDTIEKLALKIKENSVFSVVVINPAKYNQLYDKFRNLNNLLAWGHARAIENILEKKECRNVISDKFGNESLIKNALMTKGKSVNLEQRVRAEDDIAVAAASILARNEFVHRMRKLSQDYDMPFSKGASEEVKKQARNFVQRYGMDALTNVAKLHFKTTKELSLNQLSLNLD